MSWHVREFRTLLARYGLGDDFYRIEQNRAREGEKEREESERMKREIRASRGRVGSDIPFNDHLLSKLWE